MTTDFTKLADALTQDTPERDLEKRIERFKQEILNTIANGEEFELDRERGIVLGAA